MDRRWTSDSFLMIARGSLFETEHWIVPTDAELIENRP